jgi:transcriptional regulator with XRE-family HTH domain
MKTARTRPPERRSFRRILQEELASRCAQNPQYSLRAFARRLGIHHSTLSQILRGKRALTSRAILRFGETLGLPETEIRAYQEAEPLFSGRPTAGSTQFARDAADVLSDWHHFAILELTRLETFRPDVRWIARVLDVTPDDAQIAVARLARLRLLEMRSRERWVDLSGDTWVDFEDFTQVALERLAEQSARRLSASLASGAGPGRSHSVSTFAADASRLSQAIALLERCRAEIAQLLEGGERNDALVHLELHLFPITPSPTIGGKDD